MPQDKQSKFTTRQDSGIYDQSLVPMDNRQMRRPDGSYRYVAGDTRTERGDAARGDIQNRFKLGGDISGLGLRYRNGSYPGMEIDNKIVTSRDANNAKVARERLAGRASDKASESTARGNMIKRGVVKMAQRGVIAGLGSAAVMMSDSARKMPRTSEDTNDSYGQSALGGSNGSYSGQGPMSKAMKVKNTKAGM